MDEIDDVMVADSYWTAIPNAAVAAVGHLGISATSFVVYCALRTYLHKNEACWPGREKVCEEFGIPTRTFQRAITALQEVGMLVVTKQTYLRRSVKITRNVYSFPDAPKWHKPSAIEAPGSNQDWHSAETKIGTRYIEEEESVEEESVEGLFKPPPPPVKVKKVRTGPPASIAVTTEMKAWAVANVPLLANELEYQTSKFLDNARQHGRTYVDWPAAWRNWMRSGVRYAMQDAAAGRLTGRPEPTDNGMRLGLDYDNLVDNGNTASNRAR